MEDISAVRIDSSQEKKMSKRLTGYQYENDAILNAVVYKFNKDDYSKSSMQLV